MEGEEGNVTNGSLWNSTNPQTTFSNVTILDVSTTTRRSVAEIGINALLFLILFLVATCGNILVIVAITMSNKLRNQMSNILIINLAATDITNALFVMSTSFVAVSFDLEYIHPIWCNACCAMNYVCIIVSMLTLAFISVDRYIAITKALIYTTVMTKNKMLAMVAYSWFQGAAFAAAPCILQWVHYDYWEAICAIDWHQEKTQALYYVIVAFIVCFLVPGMIMTAAYTFIIREAQKVSAVMPQNVSNNNQQPQQDPAAKKANKTIQSLLIVVLFFFVCMTPFCVTKLLKVIFEDKNAVPNYANLTASLFQFISSSVNPFIYAIFRADFRLAYKRILHKMIAHAGLENSFSMSSMATEYYN